MPRKGENLYRRKDGRYEGRFIKSYKPDGKPIYGSVYAKKQKECREKLNQAKQEHSHLKIAIQSGGNEVAGEFFKYWLYEVIKPTVKPSTFSNYAIIVEKHISPKLGDIKLQKIKLENVQHFVNSLVDDGLSVGTVRNIFRVLHAITKKAQEMGRLHVNPCELVKLPEHRKKEAQLLTLKEQKKLESAALGDKNGFAIMLAIYTGMRLGEICALKWTDVDLDNEVIRVSETIQRIKDYSPDAESKTVVISGSAKSNQSVRVIPLPSGIVELFKQQKMSNNCKYVFNLNGHPLEPRTLQYRFKVLLQKAGLENINFHSLRHTFATRCMELSFDVKTLSEILGHSSAKMTLDRYGHSQIEHKKAVMQTLDVLFVCPA